MLSLDTVIELGKERNAGANLLQCKYSGFKAVIKVSGRIGDLVGKVDQLRLQWRTLIQEIFGELRKDFHVVITGMLDDSLAHFKGQIQARKVSISLLKLLHNMQGMQIVI